jgi:addiction module RelB/DinJ family antitoxin
MNTGIINIKTDIKIKKEAEKLAKELGLPLNSILNLLLTQFVLTKRLEINLNVFPEAKELKYLKEGEKALKNGKRYKSVDSLIKDCLK